MRGRVVPVPMLVKRYILQSKVGRNVNCFGDALEKVRHDLGGGMVRQRGNDKVDLANFWQDLLVNRREMREYRVERLTGSASASHTGHLDVRVICQNSRRFSAGITCHVDNSNARCTHIALPGNRWIIAKRFSGPPEA